MLVLVLLAGAVASAAPSVPPAPGAAALPAAGTAALPADVARAAPPVAVTEPAPAAASPAVPSAKSAPAAATLAATPAPAAATFAATPTPAALFVESKPLLGNILFIAALGTKSHKNFYYGIIEALTQEGYHVTLLTPYKPSRPLHNVREVVLESNDISNEMPNFFQLGSMSSAMGIFSSGPEMCFRALQSDAVAEVLQDNYHLVFMSMFFNECFLVKVHAMQVPFVFVRSGEMLGAFTGLRMGNPSFPSFDWNPMLQNDAPLPFVQRLSATLFESANWAMMLYGSYSLDNRGRALGLYTSDTPSIATISANASLMIANSFRLAEHPRPYMPNILLAGGIHCRDPQPLPQDLSKWVSSSGEAGFIFFSLGSAVRPSDVPHDIVRLLVSVFGSLPQKVLWKYDLEQVEGGLPDNVKLTKWAPQQDLLGDPHIRLFITHGGMLSTQEAAFHGVPVLGLPVYGDQVGNMIKAELQGWGKKLDWHELTYDLLRDTIVDLIEDPVMRQNVQQLGRLMKDQPTHPAMEVAWWAGYLMRTGGARHLRSGAADLSWYELYNTDVWLVLVASTVLFLWLLLVLVRKLCKYCFGAAATQKQKTL